MALEKTPRFGIVGQKQTVTFKVTDEGAPAGARVPVTIRRDGEVIGRPTVTTGRSASIDVDITHAGPNIVEFEVPPLEGELTQVNNRTAVAIDGVRDKLRVLLVSGEPNVGERTWRNLLKSDANVDLVHFTILRPPEKQDGTPINELSLIAFPTRELFQTKIKDFDLIIFDRYAQQGVLPQIYFDNIVRYVRAGGAVLVAAGTDFLDTGSLYNTPLEEILPGIPRGEATDAPYHAKLTDPGKRHPVTRNLPGSESDPPHWSRFFRVIDAQARSGTSLMSAPGDKPVLLVDRVGEGRVALLLSDHIWLWARGYEGGGPHIDLLRRLSHWLMKEPDLEEERLKLTVSGRDLVVERQTMADQVPPATVTTPSGALRTLTLAQVEPGLWQAKTPADELGLWRAQNGTLNALANIGPLNPKEFAEGDQHPRRARPHRGGHGRRRVAARRPQRAGAAPRAGLRLRPAGRRGLDGPEDARRLGGARHRPVPDVRGPLRPAPAARRHHRRLGARGPLRRPSGHGPGMPKLKVMVNDLLPRSRSLEHREHVCMATAASVSADRNRGLALLMGGAMLAGGLAAHDPDRDCLQRLCRRRISRGKPALRSMASGSRRRWQRHPRQRHRAVRRDLGRAARPFHGAYCRAALSSACTLVLRTLGDDGGDDHHHRHDGDEDGADRVDLRRHAEAHLRIDAHGQRGGARARW